MRQSQRILAVVNNRALYQKVADLLERSSFEVNRVPSGAGALILVGNLRYDLILAEAPLPDLDLQDFLAAIRTLDSPCVGSSVIVLAHDESATNLSDTLLDDDVAVIGANAEPEELQRTISKSLGVAMRSSARLLVQLEAKLDGSAFQRVGQTANISETGMLLTGAPTIPLGTEVELTFELPEDPRALTMKAVVVRHASPEVENVAGIGVRFTEAQGDAEPRLREFLRSRFAAQADEPADQDEVDSKLGETAPSAG